MSEVDSLAYTKPFQLTKTIHRDPYDALSPSKPENSAAGKIIIITGGGTGVGAAAAMVWARAGAEGVVLAGRRLEKLEETAEKVRSTNNGRTKVLSVQTDLIKDKDVENLFKQTINTFGRIPDVVLANAGIVQNLPIGEHAVDDWWNIVSINLKGVYSVAHHFIKSQTDPKNPKGTFITTNSGLGGIIEPKNSSYSIAKLGAQRLIEYLHVEYPTLRSFTVLPGVIMTDMPPADYRPYAKDHAELTGMLALYLASPQGDYLKGMVASVNWDVKEMEANKERIVQEELLKIKWVPVLPASGGKGL